MSPPITAAPRTGMAIFLFSLGIFCFALNDALGKWLVGTYPVGEILLVRTAGAALFFLPMMLRHPDSRRVPAQRSLHIVRIVVMAADSFAFYYATRSLPLADVMTFYLASPLFVTVLAVIFLRERIGLWRIGAVLLGFLGVVIALRPSGATFSAGAVVALAGSLSFATAMVITRGLRHAHWLTLVAGQFLGAGVIGILISSFDWVMPTPRDAALMLLVGVVSMLCFLCINQALRLAQASALAPFHYTSIVWAILLGWLIWGDLPTTSMWIGIALIVASGIIVWLRERYLDKEPIIEAPAA